MTGHQQPAFRANPPLAPPPIPISESGWARLAPFGIFVASRQQFDFILREKPEHGIAADIWAFCSAFDALPLIENGWDEDAAKINRIGTHGDGWPIWRLERG